MACQIFMANYFNQVWTQEPDFANMADHSQEPGVFCLFVPK